MMNRQFLKWILFMPVVLSFLWGCGFTGPEIKKIQGDPGKIYLDGLTAFNEGDYFTAAKKFEELKAAYPDSPPYSILAELKTGDCHFLQKKYVEALAAYEEFKKVHPTHEEIPYVQYQIGMCYFNQMLTLDRDQTSTSKALSSFEYLVNNTPPGIFTEKAKGKIDLCKKRLADHEFYVGDFYYKKKKFQSAALRFQGLLERYPKNPEEDRTLYFLGKSYLELDQTEKADAAFRKVITDYPKSLYYKEARAVLDRGPKTKSISPPKTEPGDFKKKETGEIAKPEIKDETKGTSPLQEEEKPDQREISNKTASRTDPASEGNRAAALPEVSTASTGKEKSQKMDFLDGPKGNLGDKSQPIDIVSDQVEAYGKENLIVFRGNVMARQKDIVIYADSIEALMNENGKGINRVTAGGNVKIQQGVRVANCQKAIFYNIDQKMLLTGEPKVSEGDNIVSGDEIMIDIEKNRVEVKGGPGGRGKAKIQPGSDIEK